MAEPESVVLDVLKELRGEMRIMRQECVMGSTASIRWKSS
jgi:hypothetical protein